MAEEIVEIPGTLTLEKQRASLRAEELGKRSFLVSLSKGPNQLFNRARFEKVGWDVDIAGRDLVLVEVPSEADLAAIRATQEAAGRQMIFYSRAYVSGVETGVAGFRPD